MRSRTRTRLIAAAALTTLIALSACGSDDDDDASSPTAAAPAVTDAASPATDAASPATEPAASEVPVTEQAAAIELPDTVRIAYQQVPNGDLIVKNQGWLEEAFGPDVKVEWSLFASGGDVNEAVIAGAVDFGLAGSSPVSRGLSTGIGYRVPWIFDVIGKAESLVAKPDITSIQDLKGKTVATPFASTSHFSLLAALDDAGIAESDVNIIDAAPDDIFAAWTRGDIDAAYVWNPNLAKLIDDGGNVLITSADLAAKGKTTYDLAIVSNDFADKYPDAVNLWAAQEDRAVKLIRDDPDAAAAAVAAELEITPAEATSQLGDLVFLSAAEQVGPDYLGGGLAKNLFEAAQFNKDQGKIDTVKAEADYQAGVDDSFATSVPA
ncbi:MAG: aliphatic sulfonates family transporter, periplasmic ligand-binding protein [Ilumatobacteraceae bacterium]|nr:aliphatic sulfonates family transporter, periplasmic ligand-binding protein [Ilumatobacteraceae bacterium]